MRFLNSFFGGRGCGCGCSNNCGCEDDCCGCNSSILFFILVFLVLFAY